MGAPLDWSDAGRVVAVHDGPVTGLWTATRDGRFTVYDATTGACIGHVRTGIPVWDAAVAPPDTVVVVTELGVTGYNVSPWPWAARGPVRAVGCWPSPRPG